MVKSVTQCELLLESSSGKNSGPFSLEAPEEDLDNSRQRTADIEVPIKLYATLAAAASKSEDLQIPAVLLSVFQELLRRYTGQTTASVEVRGEDCFLFDMVLDGEASLRQTIKNINRAAQIQQSLGKTAKDGEFAFFQQSSASGAIARKSNNPIRMVVGNEEPTPRAFFEYDGRRFASPVVDSMAAHYAHLLRAALENQDSPLGSLEIITPSESQMLRSWNQTDRPYSQLRADELFQLRVQEARNDIAAVCGHQSLTYGRLANNVGELAQSLRTLGVGPEVLVGISMARGLEMLVALLAILEAGGAYFPLDPNLPTERIAYMLEDARPSFVITQKQVTEKLKFGTVPVVYLNSLSWSEKTGLDLEVHGAGVTARGRRPDLGLDNLAYVLYTSGSTGRPKGVEITHRALTNFLTATALEVALETKDVVIAANTLSFDISTFELFGPLIAGARVVIVPQAVAAEGEVLADVIAANGATFLQATPSGWRLLIEAGWRGQPGLKIVTGGEPLDRKLAQQLQERAASVWNFYGPTEATVAATARRLAPGETEITVGRSLANYKIYILDSRNKPLPVGATGELWIGGLGVARGYRNRPDLTAERFVPDPFSGEGAARMYRTGDLGRFTQSGDIELLGRADGQVKLRGYRIELGEIEAVLDTHPSVRKSIVKLWSDDLSDKQLVAYFVKKDASSIRESQLRDFARRSLAPYMVPAAFIEIEEVPLTPNGKIDHKALLQPKDLNLRSEIAELAEPAEDIERRVLDCWRVTLRAPEWSLDDHFFDRGGHSLLAARLLTRIDAEFGQKIPLGSLLEAPTARLLAQQLRHKDRVGEGNIIPIRPGGSLPPLYLIHHLFGDILVYRQLADCFAAGRPVFGIQAPLDVTKKPELRSCESLAALYVAEILRKQPAGPYHLGGFSSGGVIAFEMARQLEQRGHKVGLLALIDAEIDAPGPLLSKAEMYRKVAFRKVCKIVYKCNYELRQGPKEIVMKRLRSVWLQRKVRDCEHLGNGKDHADFTMDQALLLAERAYRPQACAVPALLIRFRDEARKHGADPMMGWSSLIPAGIQVMDLPGNHLTGMSLPRVAGVAGLLSKCLEGLETTRMPLRVQVRSLVGQEVG